MERMSRKAIIIGAGPAGLTSALELLRRTDVQPIILEASGEIGGISRTIRYKGNRMDIGGHRFFSKSDRVMQWWLDLMPPVDAGDGEGPTGVTISYQNKSRTLPISASAVAEPELVEIDTRTVEDGPSEHDEAETHTHLTHGPENPDLVMLIRPRKSRIYYLRKFFDYPITLTASTLGNLGLMRTARVGTSYIISRFHQIKPEKSLQDFMINRFGRQLYLTFFKSYTEKVWGTPCEKISAEWGAQRIKGLSLTTAVKHFVKKTFSKPTGTNDLAQKGVDTSLIERFLYPKFGPGQLWEHAADLIVQGGGEIHMGWKAEQIHCEGNRVVSVVSVNEAGERRTDSGEFFFSTMPMRELIQAMDAPVPANVREVSDGLQYRDFITVGLLVDKLKVKEPDVLLGRLQIFNNWSPYLVEDPTKVWIGLEYFCYDTDPLWAMPDDDLKKFAINEVAKIGILDAGDVSDAHVVRVPKTYPAYFGTYERFGELKEYINTFDNLILVGRNGMHKYNNQDHSMLTAMYAVDGIAQGKLDKQGIWEINTEQEYHEEKDRK
jgi:protoporphyrinogen oxidase